MNKSSTKFFNNPSTIFTLSTYDLFQQYTQRAICTSSSFNSLPIHYQFNYDDQLSFLCRLMTSQKHYPEFDFIKRNLDQISNPIYQKCLLFNFIYIYAYLIGLPLKSLHIETFHLNLQSIVSIIEKKTSSDEYSQMFAQDGLDTFITVEMLYLSIALYLKLFFPQVPHQYTMNGVEGKYSKTIEEDIRKFILINHMEKYLSEIIDVIADINSLLRCKPFLSVELEIDRKMINITRGKCVIEHYDLFTSIIFLIKKYSLYPSMKTLEQELHMNALNSLAIKLFDIFEENMIHYYRNHEKAYQSKMINNATTIDSLLLFGIMNNEHYLQVKSLEDNYFVDYYQCFPSHFDLYATFLMQKLALILNNHLASLMGSINESYSLSHTFNEYRRILLPEIDIVILRNYIESMKDLLMNHMTASFECDNVYDITTKHQWIKNFFDVYAISDVLFIIMEKATQYNKTIGGIIPKSLDGMLSEIIKHLAEGLLCKEKLLFPIKLYHYKQIIIKNSLIIFDFILSKINYCLSDLLYTLSQSLWLKSLVNVLEDISRNQMMLMFLFSNRLLQKINIGKEIYPQRLRIYGYTHTPFNYNDILAISQEDHIANLRISSNNINTSNSKHLRHVAYPNMNTSSNEDKENNRSYANQCTNRPLLTIENPETDYKQRRRNDEREYKTSFDITDIKYRFPYEHLKGIFGNGIGYLEKNDQAFLMSTSTEPIILIQVVNGIEKGLYLQENTILSHMLIELNSREMILEYIYGENFNEEIDRNDKENYEKTVKNYDNENKMKYFAFVDQLKTLLS